MPDDKEPVDEGEYEESYQVGLSEEVSFSLRVGGAYLIKEKRAENAMMVFARLLGMGMKGLCISGVNPRKLRSKWSLPEGDCEILWLSGAEGTEPCYNPNRIDFEIMDRISEFVRGGGKALYLDSLEIIVLANGFDKAVEFVKTLSDFAAVHTGIFILSINPTAFKREQLATLEWQLEPLVLPGSESTEESEEPEQIQTQDSSRRTSELEGRLADILAEKEKVDENNRKLAEGIISVTRELDSAREMLRLKEEENVELKSEIVELSAELRKARLYGGVASGTPPPQTGTTGQTLPPPPPGLSPPPPPSAMQEQRIKALENEKRRLEEILIRRDSEIRTLSITLKEKEEALAKKSEMVKDLLGKMTDVEVRINAPARKQSTTQGPQSGQRPPPQHAPPQYWGQRPPPHSQGQYQHRGYQQPAPQYDYNPQQAPPLPCPTCGTQLMRIRGIGDSERLYCERCRKWLK